jgi:hypothetical protein
MELLLILSAMLSAVTGAFSGVRGPDAGVPQAQAAMGAQAAAAVIEQQAAPAAADRPAGIIPTTEMPKLPGFALAAAIPIYADRLIE